MRLYPTSAIVTKRIATCFATSIAPCALAQPTPWTHYAQSPSRISAVQIEPVRLGTPAWTSTIDHQGNAVAFVRWQTPIVHEDRVFVVGQSAGVWGIIAHNLATGIPIWKAPLPASPIFDSWTSLVVDATNGTVVACVDDTVTAARTSDGVVTWSATLFGPVVNASPALTHDLGNADRLFITDYSGFGPGSSLYCINVDAFHPAQNAFQPGELVWAVPIGQASGSTPACVDGVVYTAAADGWVRAHDATATTPPTPAWGTRPVPGQGFFGGIAVAGSAGNRTLFAATYNPSGGMDASTLVKLDAQTGQVVWTVPSNRTDSTPVPLASGQIVVSGGVRGFGTVPSVAMFADLGTSASRVWDSALDSWNDLNTNGQLDPGEYLDIGGWSSQPVVLTNAQGEPSSMYTGTLPAGAAGFGAYESLVEIDMMQAPSSAAFVVSSSMHAGASAAVTTDTGGSTRVLSIGSSGLIAYAASCAADCDNSGALNVFDYICFGSRYANNAPAADCDGSGTLNVFDYICFGNLYAVGCD